MSEPFRRDPAYDRGRVPSDWVADQRPAYATGGVPETPVTRRVSWGAIFAGSVVALSLQLMLNLLGLAIGLGVADPAAADRQAIAIGAGVWLLVTTIVSVFAGGWAAGRLAGIPRRVDGLLHGFVTWALATFVAFSLLMSGAGALAGGALSVVRQQGGLDPQRVEQAQEQAQDAARQAGRQSERLADAASGGAFWAFLALVVGAACGAAGGAAGAPRGLIQAARYE